ncbi:migration and invasion-inhibitory protein [Rhinophrynus dorsalis]
MSVSNKLEELRRANKCLLFRLQQKQDEFRKFTTDEAKSASRTAHLSIERSPNKEFKANTEINNAETGNVLRRLNGGEGPTMLSSQGHASVARKALCTSKKSTPLCKENLSSSVLAQQEDVPGKCLNNQKSKNVLLESKDTVIIHSPIKRHQYPEVIAQPDTTEEMSTFTPLQYADHLMDEGNIRTKELRTPKSILMTPQNRDSKRENGHVTFLSTNTDTHAEHWSPRPFLGYDWIAGLLEVESPITNRSEQFFSEINEFRRVNREECVNEYYADSRTEDTSESEDELDHALDTHQCVYCYRVNNRLFTSPAGSQPACPICKKRRSRRPPSIEEPAYIRVSIPRSTLLPPYKYKAHRRKSFDPTDSLALPSHCLAGWENAVPSCDLSVTSLDLKSSVGPNISAPVSINQSSVDNVSFYASRERSENLLNISRSLFFQSTKNK